MERLGRLVSITPEIPATVILASLVNHRGIAQGRAHAFYVSPASLYPHDDISINQLFRSRDTASGTAGARSSGVPVGPSNAERPGRGCQTLRR